MEDTSNLKPIRRTDRLALERTKLAIERTFLAYFRTFTVFLSSGFVILKIDALENLETLGHFFIGIAFILLIIGTGRFLYVLNSINRKGIKKSETFQHNFFLK